MRLRIGARAPALLFGVSVVAAGCTAILGIGGDFKLGAPGGGGASSGAAQGAGPQSSASSTGGPGGSSSASAGAAGAAGSGGTTSTGDDPCTTCITGACGSALAACMADGSCAGWFTCYEACSDSACATGCDQMHGPAKSLYTEVYACACSSCATACAAIDPCTHPCKVGVLYPPQQGNNTVYCPFASDAGQVYCTHGLQHCCEPATGDGDSTCQNLNAACTDANGADWQCDYASDCNAGEVCCASAMGGVAFAATPRCETSSGQAFFGTFCQGSCNPAQSQYQVCSKDAECPSGKTCWPVSSRGYSFGVCR